MDKLLNLIGLAQKAGRLAVGEEPTGAARTATAAVAGVRIANDLANFFVLLKSPAVAAYLEDRESA